MGLGLDRAGLVLLPTPLHRLQHVSDDLACEVWIKRDDLTGFALGGNKGRKLEYLIGQAVAEKAEAIVTCGSMQSNFIRQLGAACAVHGIQCAAAVMAMPYEYEPPATLGVGENCGNVLLDELFGVELHVFENGTWETLYSHYEVLAKAFNDQGLKTLAIPIGGSSPRGAYAFLQAGKELQEQVEEPFDWIIFASSSGSTHTGLSHAFRGTSTKILGMACDPEPEIVEDFSELSQGLAELLGENFYMAPEDFLINLDYVGPGYGVPSEAGNEAIRYLARREGIVLDPIYSGKAFAGLLDLARRGEIKGRICFWHTGGIPALFAHS